MRMSWQRTTLRLREPFRISRSVMHERGAVRVRLEHGGRTGFGEAVTSVYYALDEPAIAAQLEAVRDRVEACPSPESLLVALDPLRGELAPGVLAALDAAAHDLAARSAGVPVHALLDLPEPGEVPTARTIGIAPVEQAVRTATELTGQGFRVLKIKLGGGDDLARLAAVRAAAPNARLLLDPNGAWAAEQAVRFLDSAAQYGIAAVEQPVPPGDPERLAWVARRSPVPVIADEDAASLADVRALGSAVHGVNIKLAKCGGVRPALELIAAARESGVDVMLGCLVASSLGIAPAVHLAGLARWVDLDGHLLLAADPWEGIGGESGTLRIDGPVGLGVRLRGGTSAGSGTEAALGGESSQGAESPPETEASQGAERSPGAELSPGEAFSRGAEASGSAADYPPVPEPRGARGPGA